MTVQVIGSCASTPALKTDGAVHVQRHALPSVVNTGSPLGSYRPLRAEKSEACWEGPGSRWPKGSPRYHLMDHTGCGIGDVTSPIYDPVHGVIHHFYLDNTTDGPMYGHFVSKDFVCWAQMPVAIHAGIDVVTGNGVSVVPNQPSTMINRWRRGVGARGLGWC